MPLSLSSLLPLSLSMPLSLPLLSPPPPLSLSPPPLPSLSPIIHISLYALYASLSLLYFLSLSCSFLNHRFMLGLAGIPSLIMFIGFFFMPESPRWLVFQGKSEKARNILYQLRVSPIEVTNELCSIQTDYEEYKSLKLGQ